MNTRQSSSTEPRRAIDGLGGFSVVAGSMLGIGIFLSPPIVASHVNSVPLFLALWILGGLISLCGAIACAELGTMMPRAGGDYVFQREAYGPSVAFASGWVLFAAIFSGSIATLTVGLCTYQLPTLTGWDFSVVFAVTPWGFKITGSHVCALVLVPCFTLLNVLGASPSARTQTVLTLLPIAALALFGALAVALGGGPAAESATTATDPGPALTLSGLVVSYMAIYFAYSGWINVIYVAGEITEPSRNIPRSLIAGTGAITALYVVLCLGFVTVLGLSGVRSAGEAGSAVAAILGGKFAVGAMAFLIASALLASVNATILGGARVAFAMARGGAMWSRLGSVDSRYGSPSLALWLQCTIACLLIVSGRFEDLYSMVSLAMVVTGTLTVASIFVLRRREPDRERPYRASGYPFVPAIYVASSLFVILVMLGRALTGEQGATYPLLGLAVLVVAYAGHRLAARSAS